MSPSASYRDKCVSCGRFFRYELGASWAQQWSYDMAGEPDLHDPQWQCKPCTEKHGPLETNCANPTAYSGVLRNVVLTGTNEPLEPVTGVTVDAEDGGQHEQP